MHQHPNDDPNGNPSAKPSRHPNQEGPNMLIFRQLFDPTSSTYTYLLGDAAAGEAVLIDPVYENERRDLALLRELGLLPPAGDAA